MKKIFILLCVLLQYAAIGQVGFQKAEYFFDTDPGVGNGIAITTPAGSDIINFSSSISTGSLLPGFHFLGLRVQHNDGKWGLFEIRGFYISSSTADAANINAAEYFFDSDPGIGNGIPIAVTPGATVNFTTPIATTLGTGFHFIAIRTRGTDGVWGLFETRGFYISGSTADAANINAAEYFFDTDPGVGNGISIPVTPGSTVNFSAPLPTSLPTGFHFLAIRTRGTDGVWGLFESRGFYVSGSTADVANIDAAEYFFDTDPGVGNGISLPVTPGSIASFTAAIPASLGPGFHFLAIRTRGSDGKWGLFENRAFYISNTSANMPIVTNAEFFLDTDPGVGNGTALTVNAPGDNFTQVFNVLIPAGTSAGQHFLALRVRDANGVWGLFEYVELDVTSGPVPVTGLEFNAKKQNTSVQLNWYTLTETNSSHFEIERSTDARSYEKIGTKTAAGNSNVRSDYALTDNSPAILNYYRIKQVDIDGRFVYSDVKTIRFGKEKYFVYPVISNGRYTVNGTAQNEKIKIFNSNGQLVKLIPVNSDKVEADISNLTSGTYYLIIENKGELVFSQKIIKR